MCIGIDNAICITNTRSLNSSTFFSGFPARPAARRKLVSFFPFSKCAPRATQASLYFYSVFILFLSVLSTRFCLDAIIIYLPLALLVAVKLLPLTAITIVKSMNFCWAGFSPRKTAPATSMRTSFYVHTVSLCTTL